MRRASSIARTDERIQKLVANFDSYADTFDRTVLFTGPSLYFHRRTLELLRSHESTANAIADRTFAESLYATLTAWGMHRMGPRGAKLVAFDEYWESLKCAAGPIRELEPLEITTLTETECPSVADQIWDILQALRVSATQTRLVAGSKTLHHILPNLVPPMDREYTLNFFYNNKSMGQGDETALKELFPKFALVARSRQIPIRSRIGTGMNTSVTKVIDNAVVGYVLQHLKSLREIGEPHDPTSAT